MRAVNRSIVTAVVMGSKFVSVHLGSVTHPAALMPNVVPLIGPLLFFREGGFPRSASRHILFFASLCPLRRMVLVTALVANVSNDLPHLASLALSIASARSYIISANSPLVMLATSSCSMGR